MKPVFKKYLKYSVMKEEQIDNIFKKELGQYDSGTPEHLWAGIEARRKPNRRPAWLPWIGGLAAIFVVGLSGWYLLNPDSNSTYEELTVETHTPIADAISVSQSKQKIKSEEITSEQFSEKGEKSSGTFIGKEQKTISKVKTEVIPKTTAPILSDIAEKGKPEKENSTSIFSSPDKETASHVTQKPEREDLSEISRLSQLKSDLLAVDLGANQLKGPEGCYTFDGRGGPLLDALSFDLIGGPGIAMRKLENTGDSEQDFYLTARDSTESEWYEFGATLRANMRYTSGLVIRGGLNYSQVNEIFEHTNGNATQTIITEIRDSEGNVIGTETTVENGSLYKKTHNRLRFLDIPIMLGYEWTHNKWTFAVNAGPSFNVQFKQKGDFLSESLEPVTFTTDEPNKYDYFKAKIGINYIASVGVSRQLAGNLDWHIEPTFRYMPKSITDNSLEQRYTNVGIYTGLRYYFMHRQRN